MVVKEEGKGRREEGGGKREEGGERRDDRSEGEARDDFRSGRVAGLLCNLLCEGI